MDRRTFCAATVVGASAGCLNLQDGATDAGAVSGSETGTEEGASKASAEPIEELRVASVWELDRSFPHVGASDRTFFGRGFDAFVALEPDGSELWTTDAIDDDRLARVQEGVVQTTDQVFVGTAGRRDVEQATLYALDANSGQVLWEDQTDPTGTRTRIDHTRTAAGAIVYGSDTSGNDDDQDAVVRALETADGTERWAHTFPGSFVFGLESDGESVCVGTGEGLVVYDGENGERVSEFDVLPGFEGTAADERSVYVYDRFDEEITAIGLSEPELRWRSPFEYEPQGGITVGSGTVIVGSSAGYVVAYDAGSGEQLWETRLEAAVQEAPVADGNRVWISDESATLSALSVADGEVVYKNRYEGENAVRIAVVDDVLLTSAESAAYEIREF